MNLQIAHITEYRYSESAFDSFNELRLTPVDDHRQTLLQFDLTIDPKAVVRSNRDYYNNLVHHFHLPENHHALAIEARSRVITYPTPAPQPVYAHTLAALRPRFFEYLAPTERVPLNRNWFEAFGALHLGGDGELVSFLDNLTTYLQTRFTYRPNSTTVNTGLLEFAKSSAGVCQDFAHAMLALCRGAGIPSRYVSGYIYSGGSDGGSDGGSSGGESSLLGGEASHAWIETYLPGSGWVGFDPTNGCRVYEAHVKVGSGRDYDDVTPTRGLRRGGGQGSLNVGVRVRLEGGE